jgi:hypothetical protein
MFKAIKTADQIAAEAQAVADEARVAELKKLLAETDYVALADYDQSKSEVLAQRQEWRSEIRKLMEITSGQDQ